MALHVQFRAWHITKTYTLRYCLIVLSIGIRVGRAASTGGQCQAGRGVTQQADVVPDSKDRGSFLGMGNKARERTQCFEVWALFGEGKTEAAHDFDLDFTSKHCLAWILLYPHSPMDGAPDREPRDQAGMGACVCGTCSPEEGIWGALNLQVFPSTL